MREVYDLDDCLLLVASDRISAFDVILANGIPDKGKVLNQISAFWFEKLGGICPHHMISISDDAIRERVGEGAESCFGRSMLAKKATPLPVEFVARGYLSGSWWKDYRSGMRTIHGVVLPDGLQDGSKLPEPIFTPATKAEEGHDENISFARASDILGSEMAAHLRDVTLKLYDAAANHAASAGLILADTKFEFGLVDDQPIWIDEALSPDSSRYWEASGWQPGAAQPSFDKQFVRDYLETLDWDKTPPGPELPTDVVAKTREKYLEAFQRITGRDLDL